MRDTIQDAVSVFESLISGEGEGCLGGTDIGLVLPSFFPRNRQHEKNYNKLR